MFPSLNEQMDIIRSGTLDLLPEAELEMKINRSIKENKPMIVKLGADPSRPDLHIGHGVVLRKMRQFQDMGHHAILIIGDFTAMIGDPTGKSKTRPPLTIEETRINGQSYLEQAAKLLRTDRLEVKYNSDWLGAMTFMDVIKLASNVTVAQLIERDDFNKRFKSNTAISLHEFLYPLAQAYDSFAIKSDIELGGSDQKFNLLVGREIQRAYGMEPQCILTMPILEGTDGVEKMSKSLNNYIAFTDTPREIFGKVMSISDELITRYYQYAAFAKPEDVKAMADGLKDGSYHPRNAKVKTAMDIVAIYHDQEAAQGAFDEFERMFVKKDIPDEVDTFTLPEAEMTIVDAVALAGMCASKKEAKKMIEQGGIYIDGERVNEVSQKADFTEQKLIKVGKRKFMYMIVG